MRSEEGGATGGSARSLQGMLKSKKQEGASKKPDAGRGSGDNKGMGPVELFSWPHHLSQRNQTSGASGKYGAGSSPPSLSLNLPSGKAENQLSG